VRLTRRQALTTAGTAAAAAAFPQAALADDKKAKNIAVLSSALAVVQVAVVAYEAIADGSLLHSYPETVLRSFLGQENDHAKALGDALDQMGAHQPIPPRRAAIPGLSSLKSQQQALQFAISLERRAIATYYRGTRNIKDANALKTLASIMGCDGQHLTVLRQLAGQPAVPNAFETGAA
jgi:rubrerythrin